MVLLISIGSPTFIKINNLISPHSPILLRTYKHITDALLRHCKPQQIEIAEQFGFYKRRQEAGETIAEYAAVKHRLATYCKLGAYLLQVLTDAFVFCIRDNKLRQQLLGIDSLSYEKARDMVMAGEAAPKKSNEMQAVQAVIPPAPVQTVQRQGHSKRRRTPLQSQEVLRVQI